MLYHHDARPYAAAATEAAARAREKLESLISDGRNRAAQVIEAVQAQQPEDRIVRGRAVRFTANGTISLSVGDRTSDIHPHALHQAASRVNLPWTYAQLLQEPEQHPWGKALLADNLNTLYTQHVDLDARFLLRSVGGEVRGFLLPLALADGLTRVFDLAQAQRADAPAEAM